MLFSVLVRSSTHSPETGPTGTTFSFSDPLTDGVSIHYVFEDLYECSMPFVVTLKSRMLDRLFLIPSDKPWSGIDGITSPFEDMLWNTQ